MGKSYFVYIMANRKHGTLYTGVTNDLLRRVHEHREAVAVGFTKAWDCKHLMWFETHEDIEAAIAREKRIKKWQRTWKERLIEAENPDWLDLWHQISGG